MHFVEGQGIFIYTLSKRRHHVLCRWSRSTAASYLYDHNSFPEEFLAQVLDSAISLPGEATAALMGQSKLQDLRQIAEMEYGIIVVHINK